MSELRLQEPFSELSLAETSSTAKYLLVTYLFTILVPVQYFDRCCIATLKDGTFTIETKQKGKNWTSLHRQIHTCSGAGVDTCHADNLGGPPMIQGIQNRPEVVPGGQHKVCRRLIWQLLTARQLSADVGGQRGGRRVVERGRGRQLHRERRRDRIPEFYRPQRVQARLCAWAKFPPKLSSSDVCVLELLG